MTKTFSATFPNFSESEFKCPCGCGGKEVNGALLYILQYLRNKRGAVVISKGGGYRCKKYNSGLVGSIENSDHTRGKAADFKIAGYGSLAARKLIMEEMRVMPGFYYAYCDGVIMYADGTTKAYPAAWMGQAIHVSVK